MVERAAEHGNGDAMNDLGDLCAKQTPPDLDGARRWWERAAGVGHADAMHNLG